MKKRVFSGIQPTGDIHIGNFIGTIQNWVRSQEERENIFCIVDLHAITLYQQPDELKRNIRELAAILFASGIDPEKSVLFVQSSVAEHAELAWILNCQTPMGWMQRMTQFKEKSSKQKDEVSVGLFAYPALMAADILLYDTDLVPVGEDQTQHVEFTRDLAQRFNSLYGETFKLPKTVIPARGARIMALDNPEKKMSKSEDKKSHAIFLLDSPDVIRKKFARATTDSRTEIRFDEKRAAIFNLLTIYEAFSGIDRPKIEARFEGKGYGDFKKELTEIVISKLTPIQKRYQELTEDPARIESLLLKGADRVRPLALEKIALVKEKLGLGSKRARTSVPGP